MASLLDRLNPRKKVTNPPYTATGHTPQPDNAVVELGSAGVMPIRDIVPDLAGKYQELRTYYIMGTFDASCRASLRAVKSTIMGADFYVEPYDQSQDCLDQAEFVSFNLMSAPTNGRIKTLSHILKFMDYGISMLEAVYETREWAPTRAGANRKNYTMLQKLGPRPARSINRILFDNYGEIQAVEYNAIRANLDVEKVTIPAEKLLIFNFDEDGADIYGGKSILRSAYPHWYYKNHLYKIDAIQKERHGIGVPRAILPPGYRKSDRDAALELVQNLRTNEKAGIVSPPGWEFDFLELKGHTVDVIKSIDHHNAMIMLNVLVEFLMLGVSETGGGGGRASSATQQDIFMKSNRAIADLICDTFNLELIPPLMAYNFDTDRYPLLKVRNLGETRDLQQFASALSQLVQEAVISPDMPLEQWAREIFDAPKKVEPRPEIEPAQIREIVTKQLQQPGANGGKPALEGNTNAKGERTGNMGKGNNPT